MKPAAGVILLALVFAAGCAPSTPAVVQPTFTLIPATEAPTFTPIPPTATAIPATPEPDLLATLNAAPTATAQAAGNRQPATTDPIAAELSMIARRVIAQELDLPIQRVRVESIEPYTWTDSSLGCPLPGRNYDSVQSDGYRIVLAVGTDQYIFHTDFDRVQRCEGEFERLPAERTPDADVTEAPTVTPTPRIVG